MVTSMLLGVVFGLYGFLMANVLSQPGEILHSLHRLVYGLNARRNNYFTYMLVKLTVGCPYCIAGFHCLVFICCIRPLPADFETCFTAVVTAIFTAFFINYRFENDNH